jgi:hypothetical protein
METLEGTGTRDKNSVQVVGFDSPWLGESPSDIHYFFFILVFNFIYNYKVLAA